jgi:hypothetical protein
MIPGSALFRPSKLQSISRQNHLITPDLLNPWALARLLCVIVGHFQNTMAET